MPPLRNARLTKVTAAGGTDTYDSPGAAGADKWAEPIPGDRRLNALYVETRDRVQRGDDVDLITRRELWVDNGRPDIDYDQGDVLTFEIAAAGGARLERTGIVGQIAREDQPGLPGSQNMTVLTLQAT